MTTATAAPCSDKLREIRQQRRVDDALIARMRVRPMLYGADQHAPKSSTHVQGVLAYDTATRFIDLFVTIDDGDLVDDKYTDLCARVEKQAEETVLGEMQRYNQYAVVYGISEAKAALAQARESGRKKGRR
jgi:hypothetical protein